MKTPLGASTIHANMAEPLTLYMDLMSQPCRALFQLIAYNKLPVKLVTVQIGKMQHRCPQRPLPYRTAGLLLRC